MEKNMQTTQKNMTPSTFVPHVAEAIISLTSGMPDNPAPMRDVYDLVCQSMGIKAEDYGESKHGHEGNKTLWIHRQIQLAFRQLRDKNLGAYAGRGKWALTQKGMSTYGVAMPSEKVTEIAIPNTYTVTDDAGGENPRDESARDRVSLHRVQQPAVPRRVQVHPYSDDPYIRSLAVAQTRCFGAHSERSRCCKGCPLQTDCADAVTTRKAILAAEMEHEENAAARHAELEEALDTLPEKDVETGASIDTNTAIAQRESLCFVCDGTIAKGEECFWVQHQGLMHKRCQKRRDD